MDFEIIYGEGISLISELIELGVAHNLVDKSGAWYSYQGTRIGQGKDNVREYLKENKAVANEIEAKLRQILLSGNATAPDAAKKSKSKMEEDLVEA